MTKKFITVLLALTMVIAMGTVALADVEYTVRMNGNGNNARIQVLNDGDVVHTSAARPANNAWYQVELESGTVVAVFVRGNSVDTVNVTPAGAPNTPGGDDVSVSGPNNSSGGEGVQRIGNVEIRGNGSSARIWINNQDTGVRPANNTYTTVEFAGYTIEVFMRGNAILRWNPVVDNGSGEPEPCDEPYVVRTYYIRQFVRNVQVDSRFLGTREVQDSRELVRAVVTTYDVERSNNIPGVSGMGVLAGARLTGTLEYEYIREYKKILQNEYVWVDVTVWSDGKRDEVVREDSEHLYGEAFDGEEYYTGLHNGSREIDLVGGRRPLHMGHGQSDAYGRVSVVVDGVFSVSMTLGDTGNPPTITVHNETLVFDVNAL